MGADIKEIPLEKVRQYLVKVESGHIWGPVVTPLETLTHVP